MNKFESVKVSLREKDSSDTLDQAKGLARALGISPITARVLICRGITDFEQAGKFLNPTLKEQLPDPSNIKNIEKAAQLIINSIKQGLQITIYSDFDVDGLSAGSQLALYLHALGARVNSYIPNRFSEGYGLVSSAVEKLARAGTQLLITVDCGITSNKEILLAKKFGIQTIVLDHHQPTNLPPADVIVDPAQEGCPFQVHQLAAAGLVWMLLIILRRFADQLSIEPPDPKSFLDLAALGTICDMVPLQGINRLIAHRGLEALRETKRPGLIALKEVAGINRNKRLNAGHVGFALGPRINAAGRLSDARQVLELLTTSDLSRAQLIALSLDRVNADRRSIEEKVLNQCLVQIENNPSLLDHSAFALFGQQFHLGVIGIVAQRLVEKFNRPALVMGPGENILNDKRIPVIKGSIRGVKGFNVVKVLKSLAADLIGCGGHVSAGGLTVSFENLANLTQGFINAADKILPRELLVRSCVADVTAKLNEIDFNLVEEFSKLAPFGIGNPSPTLVSNHLEVSSVTLLSSNHLRLRVTDGTHHLNAVAWNAQGHPLLRKGQRINAVYQPEINTYQGISAVQLNIQEVWWE